MPACQIRTVRLELRVPGHQRGVVVDAKIVNVFDDKETFDGRRDLACGRQVAVGIDVFVLPGIDGWVALVFPDRVEEKKTLILQETSGTFEKSPVVFRTDVLKHTHRNDMIDFWHVEVPIVGKPGIDGEARIPLARILDLYL